MKKLVLLLTVLCLSAQLHYAQRAVLKVEPMTPHQLTSMGFTTNSVSAGLRAFPNNTFAYFSAMNIADANPVLTTVYEFVSKPGGSTATLTQVPGTTWAYFKADVKGVYQVKVTITTATGSDDTTIAVTAANFTGVGNYEGVSAAFPQCMACHSGTSGPTGFAAIFDKWKVSPHAVAFKQQLTAGSTHFGSTCLKCHVTGQDHNIVAANNGFDDVAANLGWTFPAGPPSQGKWDTLKTQFPGLVNFATIGCEMCHGAGDQHAMGGGDTSKIQISWSSGACGQCHDEPWRHNKYAQWENSLHSEAVYEGSATRTLSTFDLNQCLRCHDGRGYVAYTKNTPITYPFAKTIADHTTIGCPTCHDPHGTGTYASLRTTPASGDTLGNGYNYGTTGGTGQTCMSCHKARRNNVTYQSTNISSTWGPHHSVQSDVYLGQNAYDYGTPYPSSGHKYAVADACVDCHMYATTDTGTVNRDKVGGHTMSLRNPENNYQHTKACESCHGPKASFDEFVAAMDYDQDGTVESVQNEVKGLTRQLRIALPPVGVDSISWALIKASPDSVKYKRAYWNYQLIEYDGSYGIHNTKFSIGVLLRTLNQLGWVIPVELTSFNAGIVGNNVTLTWETASETNNSGFAVERNINGSWKQVGFVNGKGTTTQVSQYSFVDRLTGITGNTKIQYRLKQVDFDGTSEYSKSVEVNYVAGPQVYSLDQNYPNPFNPETKISFSVPKSGNVKVSVYDAMGNLVKVIFNENVEAGKFTATWNASGAASGIYFYKLEAGEFTAVKKMVLMK